MQTLINLYSKVNAMTQEYIFKLDLKIYLNNKKAQKINSSIFKTFKIVLVSFQVKNNLGWI